MTSGTSSEVFGERHDVWTGAGGDGALFCRFVAATYFHEVDAVSSFGLGYVAGSLPDLFHLGGEEPGGEMRITDNPDGLGDRIALAVANQYPLFYPLFFDTHDYRFGNRATGNAQPSYSRRVNQELMTAAKVLSRQGHAIYVNAGNAGSNGRIVSLLNGPHFAGGLVQRVVVGGSDEDRGWERMRQVFLGCPGRRVAFEVQMNAGYSGEELKAALRSFAARRQSSAHLILVRNSSGQDVPYDEVMDAWEAL